MSAVAGYPITRGDVVERHAREVRWEMDGRRLAKPSSNGAHFRAPLIRNRPGAVTATKARQ